MGEVSGTIVSAEAVTTHSERISKHPDKYGSRVYQRLKEGEKVLVGEYVRALRKRETIIRDVELILEDVDFIMSPSTQIQPERIGVETTKIDSQEIKTFSGCIRFTRLGNLTGNPTMVLPMGYSSRSLPMSVMLMAPKLCESKLLRFAAALEEATPNQRGRKPPIK